MIETARNVEPDMAGVPEPMERRRFQRVKVSILGRYMLADRSEFPCQVLEMSPGDAVIIAPVTGADGEKVIVYLDHIGRVEGTIIRQTEGGFAIEIVASVRKRDKMAAQLTWLANKDILDLPEDRRHERTVPDIRHSSIRLEDGRRYACKILDISLSGAAVEIDVRPAMGTPVTLGRMRARIVRHFDDGIAVEFTSVQEMLTVIQRNLNMQ
jgi:PilZ domain-containing protein